MTKPLRGEMTLEEIEKWFSNRTSFSHSSRFKIDWLISRIKELEDGIMKHRDSSIADEELYKLIKNPPPL